MSISERDSVCSTASDHPRSKKAAGGVLGVGARTSRGWAWFSLTQACPGIRQPPRDRATESAGPFETAAVSGLRSEFSGVSPGGRPWVAVGMQLRRAQAASVVSAQRSRGGWPLHLGRHGRESEARFTMRFVECPCLGRGDQEARAQDEVRPERLAAGAENGLRESWQIRGTSSQKSVSKRLPRHYLSRYQVVGQNRPAPASQAGLRP